MICHFFINVLKNGFSLEYVASVDSMIDALSITPLLYQGEHRVWLSFSFLRSYRVIMAYIRLEATGFLDR